MPDMETLVRAYANVGPDVPVHMNTGHVKALQRVAEAAIREYAAAIEHNQSAHGWSPEMIGQDARDFAEFFYGKDTTYV